jgi:hypothetical protein
MTSPQAQTPKKELHVIVHRDSLNVFAFRRDKEAEKAVDEIYKIWREKDYIMIWDHNKKPYKLSRDMPEPSDGLEVIVSGGYKYMCCSLQLYVLRKAGYNARFHETACFDNGERMPILPDGFREVVPEYPEEKR